MERTRIPTWQGLRRLGRSRTLQSSYIWLLVVPITAKTLEHVPSEVHVPVFGADVRLSIALPFSWVMLFACALLLTAANIVFRAFCPGLVRDHETFRDFRDAGMGFEQLRRIWELPEEHRITDIFPRTGAKVLDTSWPLKERFAQLVKASRQPEADGESPQVKPLNEDQLAELFWGFYGPANRGRPRARMACAILYGGGFVLLLLLLLQNIYFVLRHLPHW